MRICRELRSRRGVMGRILPILVLVVWGCGGTAAPASAPNSEALAADLALRFLDGHTRACVKNADCGTNLCDRSLSLWADDDVGLCVSLFRARERWQRSVIARSVASKMKGDAELSKAVWEGVEARWRGVHDVEQLEGMVLLARHLGDDRAREFLRLVLGSEGGAERLLAGISLGKMGDAIGLDSVVDASASSQPVLRVHAAWAAGKVCNAESLAVVEALASDPHPMVRQSAMLGLAQCRSPEADAVRTRLKAQASSEEDLEPGVTWLLNL